MLKVDEAARYASFARGMFRKAAQRSNKVHVVGISVRGAHALEVAMREKHRLAPDGTPVLRSAVAVNPYLGPTPWQLGPLRLDLSATLSRLDRASFGLVGKILSRREHRFDVSLRERNAPETIGLPRASYGAIVGGGRFGESVMGRARDVASEWGGLDLPTYVVVSDQDPTANPQKGREIARLLRATEVCIKGGVHDLVSAYEPSGLSNRWQVKKTISRALKEGEARTRLW